MITSFLPIAVRAYTQRRDRVAPQRKRGLSVWAGWPAHVLILDTETTTDPTQRLIFGSYRFCRWSDDGALWVLEEGLFYADELPRTSPDGMARLRKYVRTHAADVVPEADTALPLRSQSEFLNEVFWPTAFEARALVVGFNLPFDLSRLAVRCGEARGPFRGGFSFVLGTQDDKRSDGNSENRYRPRVRVKHLDSKRAFIRFTRIAKMDKEHRIPEGAEDGRAEASYAFPGHFLDLRTLVFALTDKSHSLASACETFGVEHAKETAVSHGRITTEYVDYNRRDVLATQELLEKLRAEFDRHLIDLDPCKAYSPASIAKAYLRAMGVTPPSVECPDDA
jgi:DNA polymerase III epsilon subunit-like protein